MKDVDRLVAAYDDAAGVTAEFNRNVLRVLDRELDADFEPARFEHVACWDADAEWIEMRLRSTTAQSVADPRPSTSTVDFAAGEDVRTEISAKFRRAGVERELAAAGLEPGGMVDRSRGRLRALALVRPLAAPAARILAPWPTDA